MDVYSTTTPVKARKMGWLQIDTTPIKFENSRVSHGLVTPLSASDRRRDSASSSDWSIVGDVSNQQRTAQQSYTPQSCSQFTDRFSINVPTIKWEEGHYSPPPTSPYQDLNENRFSISYENTAAVDAVPNQNNESDWTWLSQNISSNGVPSIMSFAPHDEMMPAPSDFPSAFDTTISSQGSSVYSEVAHISDQTFPVPGMWSSFETVANSHQEVFIPPNTIATSEAFCTSYNSWPSLSAEDYDAVMATTLPTVAPDEILQTWDDSYNNLPSDAFEQGSELFQGHISDDQVSPDTRSSLVVSVGNIKSEPEDFNAFERSARTTTTGAKTIVKRERKSGGSRKRSKAKSYRAYSGRLAGKEIEVQLDPNLPRNCHGKYTVPRSTSGRRMHHCNHPVAPECTKSFERIEHLRRHELIHTKNMPYKCAFCHKRFGRKDNCRAHYITHLRNSKLSKNDEATFGEIYAVIRIQETPEEAQKDIDTLEKWRLKEGLPLNLEIRE